MVLAAVTTVVELILSNAVIASLIALVACVWLVGSLVVLIRSSILVLRFHAMVLRSPIADETISEMLKSVARTVGSPAKLPVVRMPMANLASMASSARRQRFESSTLREINFFLKKQTIDASKTDLTVKLQPIQSPVEIVHEVLGIKLTDVTPALNEAYALNADRIKGVMIVDPGNDSERLGTGELRPGYVFWMVGNESVKNLTEMVSQLVKEAKSPTIPRGGNGNVSTWTTVVPRSESSTRSTTKTFLAPTLNTWT